MTLLGRGIDKMDLCRKTNGNQEMVYTMDERQLLDLWTVASCLEHAREISDPLARSELLARAQIHLTAFVLDLRPLLGDPAGSASPRTLTLS